MIDHLKAAEDALVTFRANARISGKLDLEQEQSLVASVEHAKLQIQKFEEDKSAFWERYASDEAALLKRHREEVMAFCKQRADEAEKLGYDY